MSDPYTEAEKAVENLVRNERRQVAEAMGRLVDGACDERDAAVARAEAAEAARDEARAGTVRVTVALLIVGSLAGYGLIARWLGWW